MTVIYGKIKDKLLNEQHTWLITGVAGFIGSNLLEALLKLNQKVVGLDNFSTGFQHNIDEALENVSSLQQKKFTFYKGDIRNLEDCRQSIKNVDYVLHQAALGSVPRSIATPELTHETNATGFLHMLLAARDANIKRFIYASSSSVYGDSAVLPKVETHVGNPLSPYAVSKYTNELYAKAFSTCYGMDTIGLRYFNVFGPRQNPKGPYAAVVPLWIISLLNNETIYINGDGETSRDFCYIENVMQANLLAAMTDRLDALNRIYNVTVGEQTTLNQLLKILSSYFPSAKQPIYREFRKGDVRYSLADISQIQKLLGYSPGYKIVEGLERTIQWFFAKEKNKVAEMSSNEAA